MKNPFVDSYGLTFLGDLCVVASVVLTWLALLFVGIYQLEKKGCLVSASKMSIEAEYGFYIGCMVKIDGQWQPFNEYTTVNINK